METLYNRLPVFQQKLTSFCRSDEGTPGSYDDGLGNSQELPVNCASILRDTMSLALTHVVPAKMIRYQHEQMQLQIRYVALS